MPTPAAPRSLCLLRLSALGDVTHVLPLLHTLRKAWPDVAITWVIGKDTLKQLPALLARADLLVTPDSGPMHIANAMGTKVLGLHAATNPNRSGPYSDRRFCVDRYDDAARTYRGKPGSELKWGTKIEAEGVMDLITVEDAVAAFERYRAASP